jgi:hypothetical protein
MICVDRQSGQRTTVQGKDCRCCTAKIPSTCSRASVVVDLRVSRAQYFANPWSYASNVATERSRSFLRVRRGLPFRIPLEWLSATHVN